MRILVAEDDSRMAAVLRNALEEEGYHVGLAPNGAAALAEARHAAYDLVLLDVMLPRINGIDVARELRRSGNPTPILMLTAKDSDSDIVRGLDAGADDYLVKPFSLDVLMARVRAVSRRRGAAEGDVLRAGDLFLDTASREVNRGGRDIALTPREFSLLELLLRNKGRVVTRSRMLEQIWGNEHEVTTNTIEAFIRLLRSKLESERATRLIHTVRGIGYSLRESAFDAR